MKYSVTLEIPFDADDAEAAERTALDILFIVNGAQNDNEYEINGAEIVSIDQLDGSS